MATASDEAHLAALEQAVIARRVLLSTYGHANSVESSEAVVDGLREGALHSDEMRALLRRRDDLAMAILQVQKRLSDVKTARRRTIERITSGYLCLQNCAVRLLRRTTRRRTPPRVLQPCAHNSYTRCSLGQHCLRRGRGGTMSSSQSSYSPIHSTLKLSHYLHNARPVCRAGQIRRNTLVQGVHTSG